MAITQEQLNMILGMNPPPPNSIRADLQKGLANMFQGGAPIRNAIGSALTGNFAPSISGLRNVGNEISALSSMKLPTNRNLDNRNLDISKTFANVMDYAPMGIGTVGRVPLNAINKYPLAPAGTRYEEYAGELINMSPDEYLRNVRKLNVDEVTIDNIADLKRHVESGGKLDPLHIYKNGAEDGRHRALLAKELGLNEVPVALHGRTKYEVAQATAQRNASLPVSQGGLGLPANNTAMDRAKAMGNVDVYHGSNSDITVPSYKYSGKGADQYGSAALYTATSPYNAGGYAKPFETFIENGKEVVINSGGNIMPLKVNPTNFLDADKIQELTPSQIKSIINKSTDEYALSNFGDVNYEGKEKVLKKAIDSYRGIGDGSVLSQFNMLNNDFFQGNPEAFNKAAQEATGYKGVIADIGSGEKFLMPFETSNIRSRFAAFDPFRRNEADILAGVGVGIPTTGLLTVDENKKKKTTKK